MFGADHCLHNGVQTEGVILESHVTNTITKTRVVIAVKFEDGETTEFNAGSSCGSAETDA
jgi:hypothetical protein